MTQVTGRLENWYILPLVEDSVEYVVMGDLYDDVHKRWEDGLFIHTSGIRYTDTPEAPSQGDVVLTRNSTYLLGVPRATYKLGEPYDFKKPS